MCVCYTYSTYLTTGTAPQVLLQKKRLGNSSGHQRFGVSPVLDNSFAGQLWLGQLKINHLLIKKWMLHIGTTSGRDFWVFQIRILLGISRSSRSKTRRGRKTAPCQADFELSCRSWASNSSGLSRAQQIRHWPGYELDTSMDCRSHQSVKKNRSLMSSCRIQKWDAILLVSIYIECTWKDWRATNGLAKPWSIWWMRVGLTKPWAVYLGGLAIY